MVNADEPNFRYQLFRGADNSISSTTKLWRYLTFEKFAWLFEREQLYHSRLDCLGDPFEGSVTSLHSQKRALGEPVGYMPIPELEPINNVRLMLISYATSWHASADESPTMWKLYSRDNAGVAIVSTMNQMRTAVDTSPHRIAMLGPVEYLDFDNDDMQLPMGTHAMPQFSKRKSFSHEKEVRGIIRVENPLRDPKEIFSHEQVWGLQKQLPTGINVKIDLVELVSEIVLSPLSQDWFDELVKAAAGRRGLEKLVRKSSLSKKPIY
jgi:hypothetical protein